MLNPVINPTDYNSKKRLLRVTAQVLKCISVWKHKVMKTDMSLSILITIADLQEADNLWIRDVQALLASDPVS